MSVSDLITKAKKFNASSVTYKPAKVNSRGGKNVSVQLKGQPLVLQFPLMLTWGVNERVDEQSGRKSYDLALQFGGTCSRAVDKMLANLKDFQEKVLNDSVSKSKEWFGKSKLSREVAEAMMYPILKYPKKKDGSGEPDYDRSPTLKLKIPYWEDKFKVELYNMKKEAIFLTNSTNDESGGRQRTPVDFIPKASHIKGLLACTGVWMAGGRFGVTWKLVQASVRPPVRLVGAGQCHIQSDSDDDEAIQTLSKSESSPAEPVSSGPVADDSDSSSSDDEVVEKQDPEPEEPDPEPDPQPKKKKKVVRRRKKKATE